MYNPESLRRTALTKAVQTHGFQAVLDRLEQVKDLNDVYADQTELDIWYCINHLKTMPIIPNIPNIPNIPTPQTPLPTPQIPQTPIPQTPLPTLPTLQIPQTPIRQTQVIRSTPTTPTKSKESNEKLIQQLKAIADDKIYKALENDDYESVCEIASSLLNAMKLF